MRSMPSCCRRSEVVGTQMSPRPCLAMKLTDSGVTNCAAMIRSPSFSRSASSTTMTILPRCRSEITDSMELNFCGIKLGQANGRQSNCQPETQIFTNRMLVPPTKKYVTSSTTCLQSCGPREYFAGRKNQSAVKCPNGFQRFVSKISLELQ